MKRYRIRIVIFIVLFIALGYTWTHYKGLPFVRVPVWAALPPDIPAIVSYPDFRQGWNPENAIVAPEIAFSPSIQTDAALLGKVLRMWQDALNLPKPISMTIGLQSAGNRQTAITLILDNPNRGLKLHQLFEHPEISRTLSSSYRGHIIHTVYLKKGQSFAITSYKNLLILARLPLWVEEAAGRLNWRPSGLLAQKAFKKMLPHNANIKKQPQKFLFLQTRFLSELLEGIIHSEGLHALDTGLSAVPWIRLDFFKNKDGWTLKGMAQSGETNILRNTKQVVTAAHLEVIPDHITMLFLGSTSQWNQMANSGQKSGIRKYITPWAGSEFAIALGHTKGIGLPSDWFGLISLRNPDLAEKKLSELAVNQGLLDDYEYQTFRIRQVMTEDLLPFFPSGKLKNPYFAFLGDFAVFASSRAAMEVWIDGFITGQTLARDEVFLPLYAHGKKAGEWFLYFPKHGMQSLLQNFALQTSEAEILADLLGTVALRGNSRGDLFELSGAGIAAAPENQTKTSIAWKALLHAPAATAPFPLEDRQNGETLLLIQDSLHRIYLLGPTGEIRWTRNLEGPLLSDIHPIDFYNDGNTALLFNTANQIYVLNLRGEDIGNFPLPLQSPATTGVTLAKFGSDFQQAFFIPCANGNIYGFDRLGTPLPGWNPLPGNGILRFPLLYFQDAERDFLVALSDRGFIKVLKKDGTERFPPILTDGVFLSAPDYQLTAKSSRIVAMNSTGMAQIIGLDGANFRLACPVGSRSATRFAFGRMTGDERKDYAVLDGRTLAIYAYQKSDKFSKMFEYRFDDPQDDVFCLRLPGEEKDRIGTFSRETGKIYLLDGSGRLMSGFPLAGNTRFFPADLFNNGKPVIVSAYGDSVYAYQLY